MTDYADLGVSPIINGVGPATRLGGLDLSPRVLEAMASAVQRPVRMDELQVAAGRRLAELLEAPAAYVTTGAAAALQLAASAVMTGGRPELADRLPDTAGMPNEFIVQHDHRDPYDRAIEAAGGRLVLVGYPGTTRTYEITAAIGPRTASLLFRPGRSGLPLPALAEIAEAHALPVLVDAALHVPPVERIRELFAAGATTLAVSGGKGLRGPQATGLLLGPVELIRRVGPLHQDMDEVEGRWSNPLRLPDDPSHEAPPRHGIARAMKVGREQVMGLLAAVEEHLRDPRGHEARWAAEIDAVTADWPDGSVRAQRTYDAALAVPTVTFTCADPAQARSLADWLQDDEPRILLEEGQLAIGQLVLNPMALRPGEGAAIRERILAWER
jgi:D-glucosaminate-6-phosphate ammonia-lyase